MFKIKFNDSAANATMTAEFDSYLDLVYFVADKKIKDEDFVSINFGEDTDDIIGIDGLCNYTKDVVTAAKEAQKAASEAEYPEEDEDTFEDEDEEEEVESAFSEVFGDLDSLVY